MIKLIQSIVLSIVCIALSPIVAIVLLITLLPVAITCVLTISLMGGLAVFAYPFLIVDDWMFDWMLTK